MNFVGLSSGPEADNNPPAANGLGIPNDVKVTWCWLGSSVPHLKIHFAGHQHLHSPPLLYIKDSFSDVALKLGSKHEMNIVRNEPPLCVILFIKNGTVRGENKLQSPLAASNIRNLVSGYRNIERRVWKN